MIKKVATINDLSGMGKCSLTVVIPILSALGVQACPLPTAVLSNQTGYPHFFMEDFSHNMLQVSKQWESLGFKFDGIYTGFLSDFKQVEIIKSFLKVFKEEGTLFLVDPVMGDDGVVYPGFDETLRAGIKELAFMADVITPNLTESCLLTETDYKQITTNNLNFLEEIKVIGAKLIKGNVKAAVITGIKYKGEEDTEAMLYNAVVAKEGVEFIKSHVFGGSYSGTGDILASIICGMMLRGKSLKEAVEVAVKFISLAVEDTAKDGIDRNHGVNFEKFMAVLTDVGAKDWKVK